jgi:hypothetical protein
MKKALLLLLIILQSCSSDGYLKSRDFRLSEGADFQGDSAIILTRSNAQSILSSSKYGSGFTEMNWCKDEENKECKEIFYSSPYSKKKFCDQYTYYKLGAGRYYLDKIKEMPNYTDNILLLPFKFLGDVGTYGAFIKPNFNTSPSGWNEKLNSSNFASFETKPGEIVYIGDLYFTFTKQKYWIRGKITLEVQDNYNDAVTYFRVKHPEFKNKPVVKRLVQPGVLLDNFDAGIFW